MLAKLLAEDLDIFPLYGKEPESIDNTFRSYLDVLENYSVSEVRAAFEFHRTYASHFSTPGIIKQIIIRKNRPHFDPALYTNLGKKDYFARSTDAKQYMEDYEKFFIRGDL
jgi:hypothetical protein